MFEVYSTGMALGQVKKNGAGSCYPRKERIDENLISAEITPCVRNGHKYITEPQLYDLMLEMKTDKVKSFRKWLTTEVLPTIRKTGGYVANEDLFINTYLPLADEPTKLLFKTTLHTIAALNKQIEEQKPLVEFAEAITSSVDTIDVGQLVKLAYDENIPIGRSRLFKWLRDEGYLRKNNEPYQQYIELGWFRVEEIPCDTAYGTKINIKTLVTGKGQVAIIERLRKSYK